MKKFILLFLVLSAELQASFSLIEAAQNGQIEAINKLLKPNNVNFLDDKSRTPLMWAANNGHLNAVETLLAYGADANLTDDAGESALSLGIRSGKAEIALLLLSHGVDAQVVTKKGLNALALSLSLEKNLGQKFPDLVKALLAKKVPYVEDQVAKINPSVINDQILVLVRSKITEGLSGLKGQPQVLLALIISYFEGDENDDIYLQAFVISEEPRQKLEQAQLLAVPKKGPKKSSWKKIKDRFNSDR